MSKISTFVEQEDALLGVLTVRETVSFALRLQSAPSPSLFTRNFDILQSSYSRSPRSSASSHARPERPWPANLRRSAYWYSYFSWNLWRSETSRNSGLCDGYIPVRAPDFIPAFSHQSLSDVSCCSMKLPLAYVQPFSKLLTSC